MTELTQQQIERLTQLPGFVEWLHGPRHRTYLIPVPVPVGFRRQMAFTTATLHLELWQMPAPWAVQEHRYVCQVAFCGSQEIARSEAWRWFNPVEQYMNPIPPAERRG